MKNTLTIILLLCSIGVFGQSEKITKDKNLPSNFNRIGTYSTEYALKLSQSNETYIAIMSNPKALLKITESKDSLKVYKVWFNKNAITWTSDSTFTLKEKL